MTPSATRCTAVSGICTTRDSLKGGESDEDINVEEVWDDNDPDTLGAGINVVVVDDGMDYTHEDLSANVDYGA